MGTSSPEQECKALAAWACEQALGTLKKALADARTEVAVAAAQALARLGRSAAEAVPDLERAAASPRTELAAAAKQALVSVRGG